MTSKTKKIRRELREESMSKQSFLLFSTAIKICTSPRHPYERGIITSIHIESNTSKFLVASTIPRGEDVYLSDFSDLQVATI